jgi:hypothetical protein
MTERGVIALGPVNKGDNADLRTTRDIRGDRGVTLLNIGIIGDFELMTPVTLLFLFQ